MTSQNFTGERPVLDRMFFITLTVYMARQAKYIWLVQVSSFVEKKFGSSLAGLGTRRSDLHTTPPPSPKAGSAPAQDAVSYYKRPLLPFEIL